MTDEPVTADALPADGLLPETDDVAEGSQDSEKAAIRSLGRRAKMMIILGVVAVGGTVLGVAGTLLIASLKSDPATHTSAPAPRHDTQQDALIQELRAKNQALETQVKQTEHAPPAAVQAKQPEFAATHDDSEQIKELKAKNEKLEEQLKISQQAAPPVRSEAPPPLRGKAAGAKVAEDCTITDKTEKLGERLKSCVEGFNSATR